MTKLNREQIAHLEKLNAQKRKYDQEIALLELDLKRQKDIRKNPIRDLVAEARDLGIPVRQIHQTGLGFTQVNSMLSFLSDRTEGLAATLDRVTSRVSETVDPVQEQAGTVREPNSLKLTEFKPGMFRVLDREGDEWEFTVLGLQGGIPVLVDGHDAFTISGDGQDIKALFRAKWPNISGLEG